MCWTYVEAIGHSLNIFSPSQKTLRPPLVSQAGYGPDAIAVLRGSFLIKHEKKTLSHSI